MNNLKKYIAIVLAFISTGCAYAEHVPKNKCSFGVTNPAVILEVSEPHFRISTHVDGNVNIYQISKSEEGTILNAYNEKNEVSILLSDKVSLNLWDRINRISMEKTDIKSADDGIVKTCSEISFKSKSGSGIYHFNKIHNHNIFAGAIENTPVKGLQIFTDDSLEGAYFYIGGMVNNELSNFESATIDKSKIKGKLLFYKKY